MFRVQQPSLVQVAAKVNIETLSFPSMFVYMLTQATI